MPRKLLIRFAQDHVEGLEAARIDVAVARCGIDGDHAEGEVDDMLSANKAASFILLEELSESTLVGDYLDTRSSSERND